MHMQAGICASLARRCLISLPPLCLPWSLQGRFRAPRIACTGACVGLSAVETARSSGITATRPPELRRHQTAKIAVPDERQPGVVGNSECPRPGQGRWPWTRTRPLNSGPPQCRHRQRAFERTELSRGLGGLGL
jgi:hypothetical protein